MEIFKIPKKLPKDPKSTNKSVRFPNVIISQVEEAIRGTECNFSQFVIEATRVALKNLKEAEESSGTQTAETKANENPS